MIRIKVTKAPAQVISFGILTVFLVLFNPLHHLQAQEYSFSDRVFVRVYDLSGKKTGKGDLVSGNLSGITILQQKLKVEFPVESIGTIKTRRSVGHNVVVGMGIGGLAGGILEASGSDADFWGSRGEAFLAGAIAGSVVGGVGGIVTGLFKKIEVFEIRGDPAKLEAFLREMD